MDDNLLLVEELKKVKEEMENSDCYKILGINRDASKEEIKHAYQEISKKYHPDRYPGSKFSREVSELIGDIFTKITDCYDILSKDETKEVYDQRLKFYEEQQFKKTYNEGHQHLKNGAYEKAIEKFKEALKVRPNCKECTSYIIWATYKATNDLKSAKKSFLDIIKEDKTIALPYYYLGKLSQIEEDYGKAYSFFKRALECDEKFVDAGREMRLIVQRTKSESKIKGILKRLKSFFKD